MPGKQRSSLKSAFRESGSEGRLRLSHAEELKDSRGREVEKRRWGGVGWRRKPSHWEVQEGRRKAAAQAAYDETKRLKAAAEPEPAADEVSIADIHMAHAASLDEARRSSRAAAEDPDLAVTAAFESMELGVAPTAEVAKKELDAGEDKAKQLAAAAEAAHLAAKKAQVEYHALQQQHAEAVAPPPVRRHGKGAAEKAIRDQAMDRVRRAAGVVADPMAADSTKSPKSRKSPTPSSPAAKPAKKPGKGKGGKAKAKSAARRKITSPRRKRRQSRRRKRASRSR